MNSAKRESRFLETLVKEIYGYQLRLLFSLINPDDLNALRKIPSQIDREKVFQELQDKDKVLKQLSDTFDLEFIK